MKYSENIIPISYLKTHASEVIRDVSENQKTLIITSNGEAKIILQDVRLYEKYQESIALLKLLTISSRDIKKRKYKPLNKAFKTVRKRVYEFKRVQNEL